jgi:hypothetical protein
MRRVTKISLTAYHEDVNVREAAIKLSVGEESSASIECVEER